MKLIKIENETAYYIGKVNNVILAIVDQINPLEYPYEFGEALYKLSKDINKNKIPVYIDFTKWGGNMFKLIYLKDKNNIDVYSGEELSLENIPSHIKSVINKFRKENLQLSR